MPSQTTVIITGCKSGIGKGLLSAYAGRPNTTAIAAIRDSPNSPAAQALTSLPTGPGSKIIAAQYDAASPTAGTELVSYLQTTHDIQALDIVVANAGILKHFGSAATVTSEQLLEHFTINTVAPILLYQATAPLLSKSDTSPKFFIISSNIGSNTLMDSYPMPMIAYGMSKAAANFAAGRIHREEERLVIVPVQPGWVQTPMGEKAAEFAGMKASEVPVKLEDSVKGLMKLFDAADKGGYSGKFWDQNGQTVPW